MRSAPRLDDRTAKARIRDAAITRFAHHGVAGTSVRAVADEAGVSAGLVIHHFGSKDGLREECDQYVAAVIRDSKSAAMGAGPGLDPVGTLRQIDGGPPLMRYLARVLIEGSDTVAGLVDELVTDATRYMAQGVETGMLRPTDYPEGRAAVLTVWSLGALVLHEHVKRILGVDLTAPNLTDQPEVGAYFSPAIEIFADGLVTEAFGATLRNALSDRMKETKK